MEDWNILLWKQISQDIFSTFLTSFIRVLEKSCEINMVILAGMLSTSLIFRKIWPHILNIWPSFATFCLHRWTSAKSYFDLLHWCTAWTNEKGANTFRTHNRTLELYVTNNIGTLDNTRLRRQLITSSESSSKKICVDTAENEFQEKSGLVCVVDDGPPLWPASAGPACMDEAELRRPSKHVYFSEFLR